MRRWIGVGLALLLGVAVTAAVIMGNRDGDAVELATVRGVIGSEKKPFFDDPKVRAAFARHGLRVEVDTAGSRQIASSVDLSAYDFAFPSSAPAAEKIRKAHNVTEVFAPFYSPMAVATYEPIVGLLTQRPRGARLPARPPRRRARPDRRGRPPRRRAGPARPGPLPPRPLRPLPPRPLTDR